MHISIVWHDRSFNINLHSSEGKDAFLELKGCQPGVSSESFGVGESLSTGRAKNRT
jgi:hypothetical protein